MAITLAQLAGALRIGDGIANPLEPQRAMIKRLMEVAEALVSVTAPAAPEPVRDEASIRIASYLYDAPTSAASDRYAAAMVNSGAGGLLSRWVSRRAVTGGELAPPSAGLDAAQVQALIDAALKAHRTADHGARRRR